MPFRLRLMFTADTAGMMQRVDRWGKPFWTKVENGFAVLLGVTVVTVTPLSPREYPLDILASDRRSLYPYS